LFLFEDGPTFGLLDNGGADDWATRVISEKDVSPKDGWATKA